ncbi:MAG: hypothetical protein KGN36_02285, partial [Acidobacteriota bacterium]|nr:hypothetical protein [Acidobacteriota bacterium]
MSKYTLALFLSGLLPQAAWGELRTLINAMGYAYPTDPDVPPGEAPCVSLGTSHASCVTEWGSAWADASYGHLSLGASWFGGGSLSGTINAGFSDTLTVGGTAPGVLELIWFGDSAAYPAASFPSINGAAPAACPEGSPPWMMYCTRLPF